MSEQKFLHCAIDTETTGLDRFTDQVVQVTIIPLFFDQKSESEFFKIDENRPIFNQFVMPTVPVDPGASKVTGLTLEVLAQKGAVSPQESVQTFKKWFATLGVKKILPIGHNWADFDKMFIMRWLSMGGEDFSNYFGYQNRDTLVIAHFLNDVHFLTGMKSFNPKLHEIARDPRFLDEGIRQRLEIHRRKAHNAFDDSIIVIELYNNFLLMLKNYYHFITMLPEVGAMYQEADAERSELKTQNEELNIENDEMSAEVSRLQQEVHQLQIAKEDLISQRDQLNEVLDQTKEYIKQFIPPEE